VASSGSSSTQVKLEGNMGLLGVALMQTLHVAWVVAGMHLLWGWLASQGAYVLNRYVHSQRMHAPFAGCAM
jgi:hypothetical protein